MARRVLAAVAQMTSTPSVSQNLAVAIELVKRARHAGASIVFLPEAADFISRPSDVPKLSRPLGVAGEQNEFVDGLRACAKELGIFVNVGIHELPSASTQPSAPVSSSLQERCYNTNVVISGQGDILSSYKKVHLFDVDLAPDGPTIRESNTTIQGTSLVAPIPTPIGLLGLQTCFDVRFPLAANELTRQGSVALTYPSAFAERTGAAHWEVLLRARAIENQCYVFGSAQIGEHFAGRRSYGYAMAIDPWGTVIAQCPQTSSPEGAICLAEVDLDYVSKIRREMPMGW